MQVPVFVLLPICHVDEWKTSKIIMVHHLTWPGLIFVLPQVLQVLQIVSCWPWIRLHPTHVQMVWHLGKFGGQVHLNLIVGLLKPFLNHRSFRQAGQQCFGRWGKVRCTWKAGPKDSQQNIDLNVTTPSTDRCLSIVAPRPATNDISWRFTGPLLRCPVLKLPGPLFVPPRVNKGQHGPELFCR